IEARTDLKGITAFRVEALDDPTLPSKGPGRVKHGNFVLSELRVTAGPVDERVDGAESVVPLRDATADFSQPQFPVAAAIDDDPKTGWAVAPQFGRRHVAVFP